MKTTDFLQQKAIFSVGAHSMQQELNEAFKDGWMLVPQSLVRGDGDTMLAVLQKVDPAKAMAAMQEAMGG